MYRKNSKLRKLNLLSAVFFVFIAIFYLIYEKASNSKENTSDSLVSVISVADGDTLTVMLSSKEEKVRLIGIDAPERWPNKKAVKDAQRAKSDIEIITSHGKEAKGFVNA